jgi:integrase
MAKELTTVSVRKLRATASGWVERYDGASASRGFGVRCRPDGLKTWIFLYTSPIHHKRRRFTIGPVEAISLADARDIAIDLRRQVREGKDPSDAKTASRTAAAQEGEAASKRSFRRVVEKYDARHLKNKRRGRDVRSVIDRQLMPYWADKPLASITREDVLERVEALADEMPAAANKLHEVVRGIFNWALDRGTYGLDRSPVDRMRQPAEKVRRDRVLTEDEIRAVWAAFGTMSYPFGDALKLLLLTGQRRNEVTGVRWREIDLASKTWTIPKERCKSARAHTVPLSDPAIRLLTALPRFKPEKGDAVFTASNGERPISGYARAKTRADEISGVSGWHIHDLRRTVRTELARLRISDTVAERVINHGPKGLAAVYDQHRYDDEKREALAAWAARLRDITEPAPANLFELKTAAR